MKDGTIVEDWRGRRFVVIGRTDIFGIPAVRMVRIRKDGLPAHDQRIREESVRLLRVVSTPGEEVEL